MQAPLLLQTLVFPAHEPLVLFPPPSIHLGWLAPAGQDQIPLRQLSLPGLSEHSPAGAMHLGEQAPLAGLQFSVLEHLSPVSVQDPPGQVIVPVRHLLAGLHGPGLHGTTH